MYTAILVFCGILLAGVSAQGTTVDKCSNNDIIAHAQKCLDVHNVPMTLPAAMSRSPSPLSLFTFTFQINVTTKNVICRREHRKNYTQASLCMYSKMRECATQENPLILYLIPAPDNVRKLTQQMCEGTEDYNQTCAINTFSAMRICVVTIASDRAVDFSQLSCENIEILRECTRQKLQPCGDATAQMHETNLPALERCISTTDVSTVASSVAVQTVPNCSDFEMFLSESQKCLDTRDVPLSLPDPEVLSRSPQAILTMLTQTDGNTINAVCSKEHRENYIQASTCVYSLMKNCIARRNTIFQILIPTPDNVRRLVEQECDGVGDFNQTCAVGKLEIMKDCLNATYRSRGGNSTGKDEQLCLSIELTRECARLGLQRCGEATVQMYEENLPVPETCGKSTSGQGQVGLDDTLVGIVAAAVVCLVIIIAIIIVLVIKRRRKKGYSRASREPQPE